MAEGISTSGKESASRPVAKGTKGGGGTGRRRRGGLFNLILILLVIGAVAAFWWAEQQRRGVAEQLRQTTAELEEIRKNTQDSADTVSIEVLEALRSLIDLPTEPQPVVATITDVDRLREASDFFNKAKNGDFVVLTEQRAILYDKERNIIIDVAPYTVEPGGEGADGGAGAESGATGATGQDQPAEPGAGAEGSAGTGGEGG